MSDSFVIQHEDAPCWYRLSFDIKMPAIMVMVHKDFIAALPNLSNHTFVEHFIGKFGFKIFSDFSAHNFGFEGCFKRMPNNGDFVSYLVEIPVLEKPVMQNCPYCFGGRQGIFFDNPCPVCAGNKKIQPQKPCFHCEGLDVPDEDCYECHGKGQVLETWFDWQPFYAISASFTLFFDLMMLGTNKATAVCSKFSQIMSVQTVTDREIHGGSLGAHLSALLVRQLVAVAPDSEREYVDLPSVFLAIKTVWQKMHGKFNDFDQHDTFATVSKGGRLSIYCPGDRTGVHPNDFGTPIGPVYGYELGCHNVDTPMQQLALLAGLAALWDMYLENSI